MKFNLNVALLASAVIAQGTEKKEDTCADIIDCIFKNPNPNSEFTKKALGCAKEQDLSKAEQCKLIVTGMKPEQIQVVVKVKPVFDECDKAPTEKAEKCVVNCKSDDAKKCVEKCIQTAQLESFDCAAKKAKLSNFDSRKSLECLNKCDKKDLSELFNCNYKCIEDLLKGLGAEIKAADNKDEKKDEVKKDEKKVDEKPKDGKPVSNANRVQFESLNLIAFALPLAYLLFN